MRDGFQILFFDSIIGSDKKQGWCSVTSIVEDVLKRLKEVTPLLMFFFFHTDNVGCHTNKILTVVLPYVCHGARMKLVSHGHGETATGKGVCDALISVGMGWVCVFCREGHDNVAPNALGGALKSRAGISNTIFEVLDLARNHPSLEALFGMEQIVR